MVKSFNFKMYFDLRKSFLLKYNMLLIVILYFNVGKCNSLDLINELNSIPYYANLSVLENLKFQNKYIVDSHNADIHLNGTQLIQKYGYKVQEHHVTTSDGYELSLYRIPGNGRAILLMHGLACSFVDWITVGPKQALPFLLADQGYDVWMGNARGNIYSRKNKHLKPSNPLFWHYSFNEIGSKDLPAMIDYMLKKTEKKKITYIGYSQGTTAFFVLCSMKPEYNEKIDLMIALAPVAWMKNVPNPILQVGVPYYDIIFSLCKALGIHDVAAARRTRAITRVYCANELTATIFCQNVMYLICGFDFSQANYYQLPVIYSHFPSGSSLMEYEHYAQLIKSGKFRMFDYGKKTNYNIYGSDTPPSYPVNKITVPIALIVSRGDWLSSILDVNILRSKLKNVVSYTEERHKNFNHLDYLWAKNVKRLVYDKVLALIKQY